MSSGDVGHFDAAGRLFIDGRDDDMIVSGGENVFPQEVEDLLSSHDQIAEAAVFGVDDEKFGQRLKAVVVTKGGKKLSEDEVKKYVKSNLAGYKVPRDVEFVDELPRTSTGKVLKRELQDDGDRGRLIARYNGSHAPAHRHLLARPHGAHLGRGPAARAERRARAARPGRRALHTRSRARPGAAGHLAHDRQRLRAAPALLRRR